MNACAAACVSACLCEGERRRRPSRGGVSRERTHARRIMLSGTIGQPQATSANLGRCRLVGQYSLPYISAGVGDDYPMLLYQRRAEGIEVIDPTVA